MNQHLVLTVISPDRPGIVQLLAKTISTHEGSWQESRMAHLAGKFAGILQLVVPEEHGAALRQALTALCGQGLHIVIEDAENVAAVEAHTYRFSVIGPDRTGIVAEIAQAFAERGISVDELETDCSSMPWSGEPLFEATGTIHVPPNVDMNNLLDQLDTIADELAVDIRIDESQPSPAS
ncbi:MAG TPA: ACT domain-containing protein [Cellvibrionaceae bacterium]